ncbi:ABC transporter substrate-binding protein [Salinicola rhizosphaerae]|uniref:Dehydrogenase n=1 Tax=Salinicola rhizosphaerae TaxID=1443141 RepID=A0ABQ3EH14_9GAMM|nr:ABC transporter substrate-binding protein [Salinicola rhizosphaerae]GHB34374.1 dehydrogenase [Salinicola rhizosphaerae]
MKVSRRTLLKLAGSSALASATLPLWSMRSAQAADSITVSDVGGAIAPALRKAFYDPFEKETGIRVVNVAHDSDPVTQFKLLVDSESYIWDVSMVTQDHVARLTEDKNYLADLQLDEVDPSGYVNGAVQSNWLGFSVFAIAMAYRSDAFTGGAPKSWADYWDTQKFPGRRGLYNSPWGMLECALLADGVPRDKLYPLDVDRAFAKLDKIRGDIGVWWNSGAQNTQILQNGEVDLSDTWSARALAAKDSGAPVELVWDGLYSMDGWSIPAGTPRLEQARQFVRFCQRPEQQAIYAGEVANGPSNLKAYDHIPEDRAKLLPSYPKNLEGLAELDSAYWGEHYDELSNRFQEWLLLG